MPRRAALVVVLLALAGVVGWRSSRRADVVGPADEAPSADDATRAPPPLAAPPAPPTPSPRPDAGPPPDAAGSPVEGTLARPAFREPRTGTLLLRDESGAPLGGARVSIQRKDGAGGDRRAQADEAGALEVTEGTIVCVDAAGFVRESVDGDAVARAPAPTVRVLTRARVVDVEVVEADDRTPVFGVLVHADAGVDGDEPGAARPPGAPASPDCDAGPRLGRTDDLGRVVLDTGTLGPVTVRVSLRTWWEYADPPDAILSPRETRVRFRVLPACRMRVLAVDASTGAPLAVPFEVDHGLVGTPRARGSTSNPAQTGVFDLFPGLRPGRYALAVRADGYAPWTGSATLSQAGVMVDVVARLERAASVPKGSLRLRVPLPDPAPPTAADDEPVVLLRRTEPDPVAWDDAGSLRTGEPRWDAVAHTVTVPDVAPGRYAVVVVDRARGLAGALRDLEVLPDRETDRAVELSAGVEVDVASLAGEAGAVRGLRLLAPDGFAWPVVALRKDGRTTYDATTDAVPAGERLGPLPGPSVVATWTTPDGAARTRVVRR